MEPEESEQLIDVRDAARRLDIKPRTLRWWVRTRRIAYVRVGRLVKFQPKVIDAFVRRRTVAAIDEPSTEVEPT